MSHDIQCKDGFHMESLIGCWWSHITDPPTNLTYSSIVSRDSLHIAFLIAALNDLNILATDIGNEYLNADT